MLPLSSATLNAAQALQRSPPKPSSPLRLAKEPLPPEPKEGFINLAKSLTHLVGSKETQTSLLQATRAADQRLVTATTFLSNLYKALHGHNRAELIVAVHEARDSLTRILNATSEHDKLFHLPGTSSPPRVYRPIIAQITTTVSNLTLYLGYLEGEKNHICKKETLRNLRLQIIGFLMTPNEVQSLITGQEPPHYEGLLSLFRQFKNRQEGLLNPVFEQIINNVVRSAFASVGEALRPFTTRNLFTESGRSVTEDIDLPPLELVEATPETAPQVKLNHVGEGVTFSKWIQSGIEFLRDGKSDNLALCACSSGLKGLKKLQDYLKNHNPDERIIRDLNCCIQRLERVIGLKQPAHDVSLAFSEVQDVMSHHPIWIGSLVNIRIPAGQVTFAEEPVEVILKQIQELRAQDPTPDEATISYANTIPYLVGEVAELGAYQITYEALSYFIGKRPSWISEEKIPSFSEIMRRTSTAQDKRAEILSEFRSLISNSAHIFFVKRWLLWLSAPILFKLSELGATHFADGAFSHLQEFVMSVQHTEGGKVSLLPIERLTAAVNSFYTAYLSHTSKQTSRFDNWQEALTKHVTEDQNFLRDHGKLSEILKEVGDLAVDRYMLSFNPTQTLNDAYDMISRWIADFEHPIISVALTFALFPLKALLWTFNTTLILPIEWALNKATHFLIKTVLRKSDALNSLYKVAGDSVFSENSGNPTSRVMNKLIVNLLKELSELMDKPSDPDSDFQHFKISKEASDELGVALLSILKMIALAKCKTPDEVSRFLSAKSSSGVHAELNEFIQHFFGKDLDGEVVDGAKALMTRCYYLLMDPEILNQQLFVALTSIKSGMLGDKVTETPQQLVEAAAEEHNLTQLATLWRKIITRKAAHIAHIPVSANNDLDKELKDHIAQLKKDIPRIISSWKEKLQGDPSIATLNTLHKELLNTWETLQETLLKLEADEKVGKDSLSIHKENLTPFILSLKTYETSFLKLYNSKLRATLPNKEALQQTLQTVSTNLSTFLSSEEPIEFPAIQLPAISCPRDLTAFGASYAQFTTAYAPALKRAAKVYLDFQEFQNTFETTLTTIIELSVNHKPSNISASLQDLNAFLSNTLPETPAILEHQRQFAEHLCENSRDSKTAKTRSTSVLKELKTLVAQAGRNLAEKHESSIAEADKKITALSKAAREQATLLSPPREEEAFPLNTLDQIADAAAKLQCVSSLHIPLDRVPFFRTTEGEIVYHLDNLLGNIETHLLKNRPALFGLITRLAVIPFLESEPQPRA